MLNIYIVRHGQDEDNVNLILNGHRDKKLTDLGVKQAKVLAKFLKKKKINFSGFYCSPLKRARQTASILGEELDLGHFEIMPDLIERDFGLLTGCPLTDILKLPQDKILRADRVNYFLKFEGSETFPQLIIRAKKVLLEIKKKHRDGSVLLVAHGDIGKMIFAAYYKVNWRQALKMFYFDNSKIVMLSKNIKPRKAYLLK